MRMNLFASSLILAFTSAIDLAVDEGAYSLAQVEASAEWSADGRHPVKYRRPDDHCCQIYYGPKFTAPKDGQVCWNKDTTGFKGTSYMGDLKA